MKINKMIKKIHEFENVTKRLEYIATTDIQDIEKELGFSMNGLDKKQVQTIREEFGANKIDFKKNESILKKLIKAFVNPFTVVLLCLAIVSMFTDIILAEVGEANPTAVIIIISMVVISGILQIVQETKSGNAAEKLSNMVKSTTLVKRLNEEKKEVSFEEIVLGDIIDLSAGDMIPADLRILFAKDLFVTQSALTGESEPVEKSEQIIDNHNKVETISEYQNLAFLGSSVVSGTALAIVIATGKDTLLGNISEELNQQPLPTSFEKGVNSVSWVLIRFMIIMVPIVLFINGFTKGDWLDAFLFAISIAVGLTPEMLPMIVTTSLAKGAISMSKEKTIIKNLNSIQNLGAIDVLCTDKTGTLTEDKVVLEYHLDIHGNEDFRVLRHAFLNSYYQTGLKNLMDRAIIESMSNQTEELERIINMYSKIDEIPFDFERRRMSVVVRDLDGKSQMITKGAVEEMINVCKYAEYKDEVVNLTDEIKRFILGKVDELNQRGLRVIAVAQKTNPSPVGMFSVEDELDMVLIGYLAFLDPPKESAIKAIKALEMNGVSVKILTGDNEKVTRFICEKVGVKVENLLLGFEMDKMSDEELSGQVEDINVFAKLSPQQKSRIIKVLREKGHAVGFMGDGINDAPAMKVSDVGISVDTAVDIAKESADVILLEKDLMVLEKGIIEGRKTYANMIKYIKMTASSNFGNVFSVLIASAFLPFLPMKAIHLLLLNLIYDISCIAIPWDNVDRKFLKVPRKWEASSVGKFMVWIGPVSSIFDIATYILMYFVICPMLTGGVLFHQLTDPALKDQYIAVFQAGWFVESMWSQTLVIHMIRTEKIPFIQSRAFFSLISLTSLGIILLTVIPFTNFGKMIALHSLPIEYFLWLFLIISLYMILITIIKSIYVKKYGELL